MLGGMRHLAVPRSGVTNSRRFQDRESAVGLVGQQAKAAGLVVDAHNHDFEFVDHNGQIGYDIVIKETDAALVKLQMDLYWIAHARRR